MRKLILAGLLLGLATLLCAAPPAKTDIKLISIGESHTFFSQSLGEERTINVYLPPSYSDASKKFPVLYVIDGGLDQDFMHVLGTSHLGAISARSQEMIVVGIATKNRQKELTPPTGDPELLEKYPQAGSSLYFRNFLRDEVKPFVARSFRINGTDAVIGESLAGLFIVETYLREPTLFGGYGAVSPSLWWDDKRLAREARKLLKGRKAEKSPPIYINLANEGGEMESGVDEFVDAIKPLKNWCFAHFPRLTHDTIYNLTEASALQFLMPTGVEHPEESGFKVRCNKKG